MIGNFEHYWGDGWIVTKSSRHINGNAPLDRNIKAADLYLVSR